MGEDAPAIRSNRDLRVWQRAMDLVVEAYGFVSRLPRTELYGLSSQVKRAAISVPSNIAEGYGRNQLGQYLHHLCIARGSIMELETQVLLVVRLGLCHPGDESPLLAAVRDVGRMLTRLITSLQRYRASRSTVGGRRNPRATLSARPSAERRVPSARMLDV